MGVCGKLIDREELCRGYNDMYSAEYPDYDTMITDLYSKNKLDDIAWKLGIANSTLCNDLNALGFRKGSGFRPKAAQKTQIAYEWLKINGKTGTFRELGAELNMSDITVRKAWVHLQNGTLP